MIQSGGKEFLYKNKVYPVVVDYAFDSSYILIEQLADSFKVAEQLAIELQQRFEKYKMFLDDPALFKDSFYIPFVEFVQKDSFIYKLFLLNGASVDSSTNIGVSVDAARQMMQGDSKYGRMIKNKYNYWILDVLSDSLSGPLTKDEYFQRRRLLKIPNSIKLTFED